MPVRTDWKWSFKKKVAVWAVAVVVGGGAAAAIAVANASDHSSTAGTLSAAACLRVVDAAREAANGSRSMSSLLGVVKGAEGDARSASDMDGKYLPITQAIVGMRADLEAGRNPTDLTRLVGECG